MSVTIDTDRMDGELTMQKAIPALRIIGVEIRAQDGYGEIKELACVPCDVIAPSNRNGRERVLLTFTFHTDRGDINGSASYDI